MGSERTTGVDPVEPMAIPNDRIHTSPPGQHTRRGLLARSAWLFARTARMASWPLMEFYMNVQEQIKKYIAGQPEPKRSDMQELHRITLQVLPACKLWFFDGKGSENQTIANPTIGYGLHTIKYANGKTREFFQIGLSANKTGISVYILGIKDKTYLAQTYGKKLGKASVSGYCIRFKTLKDINTDILEAAIRDGFEGSE